MIRWLFVLITCFALACRSAEPVAKPAFELPETALAASRTAMEATDAIRAALADDTLDGVAAAADAAARALRDAAPESGPLAATAEAGAGAADRVRAAEDLDAARRAYSELAESLFAMAAVDPRLQDGWAAFRCPMTSGFPKWYQRPGDRMNPYMGRAMLTCGVGDGWGDPALPADLDGVAYHTCPMHPSVKSDDPNERCPICGMDLVPVTRRALQSGEVRVDALRRQELGIRTAPVVLGALDPRLRATGVVQIDDTARADVTARVDGYVERLLVEQTGVVVRKGQPLLELYSPELLATQQDLFRALAMDATVAPELLASARTRLELWGLTPAQIDGIVAGGEPVRRVPLLAPASGTVIDKDVVEGGRVMAGQRLYSLADLSRVWIEAKVFEGSLERVAAGQPVEIEIDGDRLAASVERVLPSLDEDARSGRVRIGLRNPDARLRVGSWVPVTIATPELPALIVPREAVIHAGPRRIVFVDLGDDRLVPRVVRIGRRASESLEIVEGLLEGERVVISGNFLIAAESRLQAATGFWADDGGTHGAH